MPYLQKLDILPILVPNHLPDPAAYRDGARRRWAGADGRRRHRAGTVRAAEYRFGGYYASRDQTEYCLLEWAVEQNRPVLGICRGIQMLNVFFGGGLVQDIPSQLHSPVKHDDGDPHDIRITDPRVAEVIGVDEMRVNTHHHQGITADLLAAPLEAFAILRRRWRDRRRASPRKTDPRRAVASRTPNALAGLRSAPAAALFAGSHSG